MIRIQGMSEFGSTLSGRGGLGGLAGALGATDDSNVKAVQEALNALDTLTGGEQRYAPGGALDATGSLSGELGFRTFLGIVHVFRDFADDESSLGFIVEHLGPLRPLLKILSKDEICIPFTDACVNDNTLFDLYKGGGAASKVIALWNIVAGQVDLPTLPNINFTQEMKGFVQRIAGTAGPVLQGIIRALDLGTESRQEFLDRVTKSQALLTRQPIRLTAPDKPIDPTLNQPRAPVSKKIGPAVVIGGGLVAALLLARA